MSENFKNGAQRLSKRLDTLQKNLAPGPVLGEVTRLLLDRTLRRFDAQVDPDNLPWRPLSPATLARKNRLGFSNKILVERGKLRASIAIIRGEAQGLLYTNTGAQARIGIKDPDVAIYARYHQEGTKNTPQRRFLGIGRLDVKAVDSLVRRIADDMIKKG